MNAPRTLNELVQQSYARLMTGQDSEIEIQLNVNRGRSPISYPWLSIKTELPKKGGIGFITKYRLHGDRISPLAAEMLMEAYGELVRPK